LIKGKKGVVGVYLEKVRFLRGGEGREKVKTRGGGGIVENGSGVEAGGNGKKEGESNRNQQLKEKKERY